MRNLKPLILFVFFFTLACKTSFIETHSIKRYVLKDRKIYCSQARSCTFRPGNVTGWGCGGFKCTWLDVGRIQGTQTDRLAGYCSLILSPNLVTTGRMPDMGKVRGRRHEQRNVNRIDYNCRLYVCTEAFAMCKGHCFVRSSVLCAKAIALCEGHCFVRSPVLCAKVSALCKGHCFVQRPLLCAKTNALCEVHGFVQSPPLCAKANKGHCYVQRPLLCTKAVAMVCACVCTC